MFFYIYFWVFALIIVFLFMKTSWPNWRWIISLWASLCCWNTTSNRISTNLRFWMLIFHFKTGILIWILLSRLCNESFVTYWIFMLLTFIADIIIRNFICIFRISLAKEIIILLYKCVFWLRYSFMRIFLWFHYCSLISTGRINLAIQLSYILWLSIRSILQPLTFEISAIIIWSIFSFEINLCRTKNRISILILLFGITSGHNLVVLALKLHLLNSLPLHTIQQSTFKFL